MDENFRFLSGYHPDYFVTALTFGAKCSSGIYLSHSCYWLSRYILWVEKSHVRFGICESSFIIILSRELFQNGFNYIIVQIWLILCIVLIWNP